MRRHCLSRSTWRPLCGERNYSLPFALCFYPHSRGAHSFGGSVHDEIRLFGLKALQSSERPSRRVGQVRLRSHLMLDPKRVRAREAVAIRHFEGRLAAVCWYLHLLCVLGCAPSPLSV